MEDKIFEILGNYGLPLDEKQEITEKLLNLFDVSGSEQKQMYQECLEKFVPVDKWDDANLFLSTYGSGLAEALAKREERYYR